MTSINDVGERLSGWTQITITYDKYFVRYKCTVFVDNFRICVKWVDGDYRKNPRSLAAFDYAARETLAQAVSSGDLQYADVEWNSDGEIVVHQAKKVRR